MNKHDIALLESAIKAQIGEEAFDDYHYRKGYMSANNALKNDADAFRMMLDLRIDVRILRQGRWVAASTADARAYVYEHVPTPDPGVESQSCALARATRRAIVRAAAHMGGHR